MSKDSDIRLERLCFALGQLHGQLAELLNNIAANTITIDHIYTSLRDVVNASSIYIHNIHYANNEED